MNLIKIYLNVQYEIREREKRKRDEEDRRRAEEIAKKSPPKSPEERTDGARSPEQVSEREALQSQPSSAGNVSL